MSDIFISYSSKDRARAKVLAGALERKGWSVWWDRKIPPGRQFSQVIKEAMDEAKCVIVLWSKESVKSAWVQNEAAEGARREILVPALIDDVEIPFEFRRIQAARLVDWEGKSPHSEFDSLLEAVRAIVGQPLLPKASEPTPDEQKPGLESEKAWSKSQKTKVLAAICIVALIAIVSIGVFLKYGQPKTYSLTATAVDGSVTKSPDQASYNHGETVTLEAVPNPGYSFKKWSGDLSDSTNPSTLVMNADKSVTASFALKAGNVVTNSIGMKLVYIPAGSFAMGSSRSAAQLAREYDTKEEYFTDEFPQHQVRISEGFWMGQTEVTQGQYKSVMNAQPWSGKSRVQEDANNPAVYVSWDDATAFCRKLSQQEGKTYRLPTEAEWEYACRAGTTTQFSFGDSDSSLGDYAWCRSNAYSVSQDYTHSVGQKKPNPWDLYDMHGNVWEWCSDWYVKDYYSNSPSVDPKGPLSGADRSLRGGSWLDTGYSFRCPARYWNVPDGRDVVFGFRVVRSLSGPHVEPDRGPKRPEVAAEEPESKAVLEEATQERLAKQQEEERDRQPKAGNVVPNSIVMKLVYIPSGSFMMGSSRSAAQLAREYDTHEVYFTDEFPQHQVRISEGFWMCQTEVTQGQYKSVMNAQPWSGKSDVQESANNPAVYVTWDDAAAFCRKLSQQEGKTYRLPTEAEWEYACRAGTTTRFSFGDNDSSLYDHAWFYDNAHKVGQKYAHSVGQKKPNPWGLYDMHGNVWEWCSDWYKRDYYAQALRDNAKGPPTGTSRSLRGGSWVGDGNYLRCSQRSWNYPDYRIGSIGFRVVRSQS